jgi:uroporphyrinogen decarboxylase
MKLTSRERMQRTLAHEPVDEIPFQLDLWPETIEKYVQQGHLKKDEDYTLHFGQDILEAGCIKTVADLDFVPKVIEETDDTITTLDGNGAILKRHKKHSATPEHVDFTVKDRRGWDKLIRPHLLAVDRRRILFDDYIKRRDIAAEKNLFFSWCGAMPFELMHPVCGHEYMLMGMALDPDWVRDMVETFTDWRIMHAEVLFAEVGKPDGFFFYEDLGFKGKPFMSPDMYREIMQPGHRRFFDYAHSLGCKIIVHSCGFIEPLIPGLIEAGMDCLQAMEVKAGMDMPHLFERFGNKISYFGNIDIRSLTTNDCKIIDEELERKIVPVVSKGGSYILHTDHSEPPEIEYETLLYFIRRGKEIARSASRR